MTTVLATMLAGGCYTGAAEQDSAGSAGSASSAGSAGSAGDAGDAGEDAGEDSSGVGVSCEDGPAVGRTPLRRLTRDEYNNTVRDLLHIDARPADKFLPDEKVGPFFSNAVAPVTELIVGDYMDAGEELAKTAVDLPDLLPCAPETDGEDACAATFIDSFGARAFRRPLQPHERQRLLDLYTASKADGGFKNGIRLVVQAMLQSPHFLYHVEFGDGGDDRVAPLTGHELASRLSYFLWASMPDDELFTAAESGLLATPEELRAQALRMLDDPKSEAAIANFHVQWLGVDKLQYIDKDELLFPLWSDALRDAMVAETGKFANYVLREGDASLKTLLTADFSFPEGPLFELYGLPAPEGQDPAVPVALDPAQRSGLLTHASVLATHAHTNQSSPVHRGVMVRENLFCEDLPPPPMDVDNTAPDPAPGLTTRERFAEHTANEKCAACHKLIDGVGFGFEAYGPLGEFRSIDNGLPVDASGELVGSDIDGPFVGVPELASKLVESEMVRKCVSTQWFRFAFGRMETLVDKCARDDIHAAFAASNYNVRELLLAIVTADSFRYRSTAEEN